MLFGLVAPRPTVCTAEDHQTDTIQEHVKRSMNIHLVQGPPGTGKTSSLLTSYIEDIYTSTDKRIMILSFTNRAVDEICNCLLSRDIPFIRTGNSQSIEAQLISNVIAGKRFQEITTVLKANRIFVATVQSANAWYRDLFKINSIDEIIIDEASQITESSILGILSGIEKVVFIGDQNQLPPILVQPSLPYDFQHQELKSLCYGNPNQSLMERLFQVYERNGWTHSIDTLTQHFRMHKDISALVDSYYKGRLVPMLEVQSQELCVSLPHLPDKRIVWIDCPVAQHEYYDPVQISLISKFVQSWDKANLIQDFSKDIGIVAPYRAMIYALRA
ncbi:MAG TPA: AAA domain-containing protein, partial [Candidatus Cloacimonadota bacterium]|nr:AAA domain-containing protein [Candidatus Cloacimonadota bacterium]